MNARIGRVFRGWGVVVAVLASIGLTRYPVFADGSVNRVYVFNGGATGADGLPAGTPGDPFNNNAVGLVLQQMGMLGAEGQPPTVAGNNVQQGANNVGTVIRDGANNIIGYQSADGKSRAYNLDAGATMAQAWNAAANGATVIIDKHGQTGGGGITLDGGTMYDGFTPAGAGAGPGTGAGNPAGPYPLPPRPGAGITLNSNGCDTSADPPGAPGSVSGSGAGVPGVGASNGNPNTIYKNCNWRIVGAPAAVTAGQAALEKCAKKAGFKQQNGNGHVGNWLASLPMKDQLQAMRTCLGAIAVTPSISYTKTPNGGCGGGLPAVGEGGGCYYEPIRVVTPSGGTIHYQSETDANSMDLIYPPGTIAPFTPLLLGADVLANPLPEGTEPATLVVGVHAYGPDPDPTFFGPVQLLLTYPISVAPVGFFEVLPNGTLVPHPASVGGGQVQTQLQHGGQYVLLMNSPPDGAVPTLSEWGLIVMGAGVVALGLLVIRRRMV